MTPHELRRKYLDFFISKGHSEHPSGSLIPYDVTGRLDESLLFNGAGMVQFKPYFRGVAEPSSKRLTTAQKCFRTGDIDEVGNASHLTFFEMLGNFSFGDYFKLDAIDYSWEFLTSKEWLGLDPGRLSFTVFETDNEAFDRWSMHLKSVGIDPTTRVFRLGEETNYWPAGAFSKGPPGPCGPNSEMFYWTSDDPMPTGEYSTEDWLADDEAKRWVEIWNDVFIQYEWQGALRDATRPEKGYEKTGMPNLPFRSIDTGMGLERTAMVLSGLKSVYDTEAFQPILRRLVQLSGKEYDSSPDVTRAMRIIADHLRGACFCIADGVLPANNGRGYVLRRLIRRAVLKGARTLGFGELFFFELASVLIDEIGGHYTELADRRATILETLRNEEALFRRTLEQGTEMLEAWLGSRIERPTSYLKACVNRKEIAIEDLPTTIQSFIIKLTNQADLPELFSKVKSFSRTKQASEELSASLSMLESQKGMVTDSAYLDKTIDLIMSALEINGRVVFQLYDTYGFPLEVTQEICEEAGVTVDIEGYREAMAEAQERSRASAGMDTVYGGVGVLVFATETQPEATEFLGYTETEAETEISGAHPIIEEGVATDEFVLALRATPFYAESGGQVGDTGVLVGDGFRLRVVDVTKQDGIFVHVVKPEVGEVATGMTLELATARLNEVYFNQKVKALVDGDRRRAITRNHTATHLMHAALRETLGTHVTQAGSLVNDEILRFDFTHGAAMTPEQISQVEQIVYRQILASVPVVTYADTPIEDARAMGAMALFGEKYADRVRVVQIGGMPPSEPSFSRELCGGVHVGSTGEIGLFKILHEASAASGVRRITAVTGMGAFDWVHDQQSLIADAAGKLKAQPRELAHAIEKLQETLREERKKREKMAQQGAGQVASVDQQVGAFKLRIQKLTDADAAEAKLAADRLVDGNPDAVALVSNVADGKVSFVCKVGDAALKAGAKAGDVVREVAKAAGGGGGGRPDFATAGGKDVSAVDAALAMAESVLSKILI
jgi:alanyl-tRNA synthetase